jgi:Kef-type K+ transport system membrane component KefB
MKRLHLPAILGWLIAGMALGPYGFGLLSDELMDSSGYNTVLGWMQTAFGLMLGTELVWRHIKSYGKALVLTTLTQSLGTFLVVSLAFSIIFYFAGIPIYLAFVFGSIALATAPAPALSIVQDFHCKGPVTDTLLPMAVLDDIVGIIVFFSVNAVVTKIVSGGSFSWYLIPLMIFLPILLGILPGWLTGKGLQKVDKPAPVIAVLLAGVTATFLLTDYVYAQWFTQLSPNYMLAGVSFSTVFSNMVDNKKLTNLSTWYNPILTISLIGAIVDLGAPLDYHLIAGAGIYTFIYIGARAFGKYFGARFGATATHMPKTVQKYLGLTLLPHSGVSLVFTGIAAASLSSMPELVEILQGTIAAAAVINEIIAVIAARQGFAMAGEIPEQAKQPETKPLHSTSN